MPDPTLEQNIAINFELSGIQMNMENLHEALAQAQEEIVLHHSVEHPLFFTDPMNLDWRSAPASLVAIGNSIAGKPQPKFEWVRRIIELPGIATIAKVLGIHMSTEAEIEVEEAERINRRIDDAQRMVAEVNRRFFERFGEPVGMWATLAVTAPGDQEVERIYLPQGELPQAGFIAFEEIGINVVNPNVARQARLYGNFELLEVSLVTGKVQPVNPKLSTKSQEWLARWKRK